MKIRKQYIIFIFIVCLLLVLALVSIFSHRDKPRSAEDVSISYEQFSDDSTSVHDLTPELQAGEQDPFSVEEQSSINDSETVMEMEEQPTQELTTEVMQPESTTEETPISVDVIPDDDIESLSVSEERASILALYVCGFNDMAFDRYLTPTMIQNLGKHTDEEPYKSLLGNYSISNITTDERAFSFTVADGTVYKFEIVYEGELVSDLKYIHD